MVRFQLIAWSTLLLCWLGYALAGARAAGFVASKFGGALLRMGQGKFNDPALFVQNRLREALWLMLLALLWVALQYGLERMIRNRSRQVLWRWAAHGVAGFLFLNAWVGFAANTALYWAVLGAGSRGDNYMQFQFKRVMAGEIQAPVRAVLVGSSQTRAQIDENLLNARLGTNLWTTELHFPGSKAYDLLLIEPQLKRADPQWVICYFTEGYLYSGSHGETPSHFLDFAQLPDAWRRGALRYLSSDEFGYGLLGDVLPLFRCRGILSQRLMGFEVTNLKQSRYDASLAADLEARARASAGLFRMNDESDFQKRALEEFLSRCARAGRRVLLLTGGYHPALMRQMDPALRADMVRFLTDMQGKYSNVTVIPASELPEQSAADYEDLNHATRDAQQRFTLLLGGWMGKLLAVNSLR